MQHTLKSVPASNLNQMLDFYTHCTAYAAWWWWKMMEIRILVKTIYIYIYIYIYSSYGRNITAMPRKAHSIQY
jgi:hypothetical protein